MPGSERESNKKRKRAKKRMNTGLFLGFAVCVSVVSIAVAAALHAPAIFADIVTATPPLSAVPVDAVESDTIANRVYIDGISVAGLTVSQALEKLETELRQEQLLIQLNLIHNEIVHTYTLADFNVMHDFQAAVDYAYTIGRENRASGRIDLVSDFFFDSDLVSGVLVKLVNEINQEAVEAQMIREDGEFIITPEVTGFEVKQHLLVEDLVNAINARQPADIIIAVEETVPALTEEIFLSSQDLLGTFSTVVTGNDAGRNQNLINASLKIDNYMVMPGEIFSTNRAFGEMSYANGYRMAPVILNGELVPGMGGGICQVSTGLYIALVHAELRIVERLNHSMRVGYADYGWDATLAGDVIDLRFENDTEYPVLIVAYLENGRSYVHVFGNNSHRSPERRLELFSTITERSDPPEETIIEDDTMAYGERHVQAAARGGVVAELWKIVFEGNTEMYRERVNTSRYRARAAIVRVGTGESAEGAAPAYAPETTVADEVGDPAPPFFQPEPAGQQPEQPGAATEAPPTLTLQEQNPLPPAMPSDLAQFIVPPAAEPDDRPPVVD